MVFSKKLKRYLFSVFATTLFSSHAFAGGFQLWEQDASDTGDYHAGAAAEGETAGNEFYNPASITQIKKAQVSFGGALIGLSAAYSGSVTTDMPRLLQTTLRPTYTANAAGDTTNIVPNFHIVVPLPKRFSFSFGVTTPFGLETDYPNEAPINLLATKTQLTTINLNPSVAYEVNHWVSLGFGVDDLYGQAIYNGSEEVFNGKVVDEAYTTQMSAWDWGYNAGVLFHIRNDTRLGLSYRSEITVDASGPSHSTYPGILLFGVIPISPSAPVNTTATATLNLPATSIASLYHNFNSRFAMMASAFYTQWSEFSTLTINSLATPAGSQALKLAENYRNTWNLALGAKFYITKTIALLTGFGHDDTPTRYGYRDIRLPDGNRYVASMGLDIHPTKGFWWSMGWTHFFMPTVDINNTQSTNAPVATSIGTETGTVDVFGMQISTTI